MTSDSKLYTILDAKAATGVGAVIDVFGFKEIVLQVGTASSANLTVKFAGSVAETAPNFAGTQTVANNYDYLDATDMEDGASIDGDTGFAPAGTDDFRLLRINVEGLKWFNAVVTARSAGSVTILGRLYGI